MAYLYCPNCGSNKLFKKQYGVGSLILVLFTFGFWIFALPFYPKRCISCGLTAWDRQVMAKKESIGESVKGAVKDWTWREVLFAIAVIMILMAVVLPMIRDTFTKTTSSSQTVSQQK